MLADQLFQCTVGLSGLWVKPRGRQLGEENARYLTELLLDRAVRSGRFHVYLDVGLVTLDDFVLVRLVVLHFRLARLGGGLWLTHPAPGLYEILRECRMTEILDTSPDVSRPFENTGRRLIRVLRKARWG